MLRPHIFFFSGIDGSGKSTHARLLYVYARRNNLKVLYVWLRWSPLLTYILLFYSLILKRTLKITFTREGRRTIFKIHIFWVDPVLKRLFPRFLLFDSLIKYFFKVIIAYIRYLDLIIFDRYFLDVIVDLLWETRNSRIFRYAETKAILGLINKQKHCGLVFFANPSAVIDRKTDIISIKEIKFKYNIFKILAKELNLETRDTTSVPPSVTFNAVKECFCRCVRS
ncbi:MAG: hypothetical protein QXR17_08355 [Candidatus Bathyarchaeia archaeon]